MKARAQLTVLLALAWSCGRGSEAPPGAYALALAGPAGPFHGPVTVTATPQPARGTTGVRFTLDGVPGDLKLRAPYQVTLDFSGQWGGVHRIVAVAQRDDGSIAEASIDLTYDPFGPSVTVLAPAAHAHAPPEGGALAVAFLASDASGLTSGAVQLGDAAPVPVPLPSLSFSVQVPAATDLPATTSLSWWFADAAGNRTTGAVPIVQTHEVFRALLAAAGAALPLPGGRLVIVEDAALRAYDAAGAVAWSVDGGGVGFSGGILAAGGDFLVERTTQQQGPILPDAVERLHADGSTAWQWAASAGAVVYDLGYLAASDSVVVLRQGSAPGVVAASRIDAIGQETVPLSQPSTSSALLVTPVGASPGGFAVATATGADFTIRYDVFDASGAPAWSCDFPQAVSPAVLLTRDAIFGPTGTQYVIQGPSQIFAALGAVTLSTAAPNGDLLVAAAPPAAAGLAVRYHPDGTIAWQTQMAEAITSLVAAGDRAAVTAGTAVRVVDAAGGTVDWNLTDGGWDGLTPAVVLSPSGGFYVMSRFNGGALRMYRAAADGTTLWQETLDPSEGLFLESAAPDDERLLVSLPDATQTPRLHVYAP